MKKMMRAREAGGEFYMCYRTQVRFYILHYICSNVGISKLAQRSSVYVVES